MRFKKIPEPQSTAEGLLSLILNEEALLLEFLKTKAGRMSPYFFNAGLINHGRSLRYFARFYAQAILDSGVAFDMLFGPAYKGIPLVAAVAIALDELGRDVPFAFNRKEMKDHGEGGRTIGAPLGGDVLVVDDVISAGTSVRESIEIIENQGAQFAGLAIALDRQEKGTGELSAVQEVQQTTGMPVIAVATLADLINYLSRVDDSELLDHVMKMETYRAQYGAE